mgnify:CR=1 FL=1
MAVAAVCMLGTSNAQAQEFTIQGDLADNKTIENGTYTIANSVIKIKFLQYQKNHQIISPMLN